MTLKDMPTSSAKKSAVIISQDGEIEQHIPHNEDELNVDLDSIEAEAPPTINQVVYVNTPSPEVNTPIDAVTKHNIKIILIPVALLLLMLPIFLWFSSGGDTESIQDNPVSTADSSKKEPAATNVYHPQSISELKKIASTVLNDEQQVTANIDLFIDNWNLMDKFSRQDFSDSFWMKRFRSLLDQKIENFASQSDKFSPEHSVTYKNSLQNMATVIGPKVIEQPSTATAPEGEFDEIFKEISSELAMAEMGQDAPVTESANEADTFAEPAKTSTKGFTESDVNYLLGQYATTYEFGHTVKIMKLFSVKSSYKKALKKNFKKVFAYSSDRNIRFSNFNWQFFDNTIVGHGKYKAVITLKRNKGIRHVNADIRVKLLAGKNKLSITRMNFSKVKVRLDKVKNSGRTPVDFSNRKTSLQSSVNSKLKNSSKRFIGSVKKDRDSRKNRLKIPTAAELQDIVTRFIGAYEAGNINALDDIFSRNAKTNDQSGLKEIKKDYQLLFKSTSDRQLFIQDIKWTIVDNNARGKGILNLLIVAAGSNNINSQQGEIQITAKKSNDKILITHLFHDLRN